jgi:hypothetical protein
MLTESKLIDNLLSIGETIRDHKKKLNKNWVALVGNIVVILIVVSYMLIKLPFITWLVAIGFILLGFTFGVQSGIIMMVNKYFKFLKVK